MDGENTLIYGEEKESKQITLPPKLIDLPDIKNRFIEKDNFDEFEKWMESQHQENLLNKLISNIGYISNKNVQEKIKIISSRVSNFIGDNENIFLIFSLGESGEYITDNLILNKPPEKVKMYPEGKRILIENKNNRKYVFVDDGAYSGSQSATLIKNFIEKNEVKPDNFLISFIGATDKAIKKIKEETGITKIFSEYKIPTITEIFTPEEQKKLETIFTSWKSPYDQAVLTFFEHRIPDNFFGGLRRRIGNFDDESNKMIFLIDDVKLGKNYPKSNIKID